MIVKICKQHGPISENESYLKKNGSVICNYCNRNYAKKYYSLNRERLIKEKTAYNKIWDKNNPYKGVEYNKKYWKKGSELLNDNYIKDRLRSKSRELKYRDIPNELVEAKRAVLMLERKIKEINK